LDHGIIGVCGCFAEVAVNAGGDKVGWIVGATEGLGRDVIDVKVHLGRGCAAITTRVIVAFEDFVSGPLREAHAAFFRVIPSHGAQSRQVLS
jgi:hypothetical protein